jgi:hypothetical protein
MDLPLNDLLGILRGNELAVDLTSPEFRERMVVVGEDLASRRPKRRRSVRDLVDNVYFFYVHGLSVCRLAWTDRQLKRRHLRQPWPRKPIDTRQIRREIDFCEEIASLVVWEKMSGISLAFPINAREIFGQPWSQYMSKDHLWW